jgi:hypothetical protein
MPQYFRDIQGKEFSFDEFKLEGLYETCVVANWNIGTFSAFAVNREKPRKPTSNSRTQDLPDTDT